MSASETSVSFFNVMHSPSLTSSLGLCACPRGQLSFLSVPYSPEGAFEFPRAFLANGGSLCILEKSAPTYPHGERESNARESIFQTLLTLSAKNPYSGYNLSWGPRGRGKSVELKNDLSPSPAVRA